ncbi:MAG TPA: hypothetical protein VMI32_19965 [Candidatus Solibacter sp.]|nr:hypothetical protein [Candidatus Solibacter sp.]
MSAEQIRNRTVGCKMTDSEYERLSAVVEREGMTLGEWVREVLLERADGRKPSVIEETLLAEVLALRTILLNVHFTVAKGESITAEGMQAIIDRADAGKAGCPTYRFHTWVF